MSNPYIRQHGWLYGQGYHIADMLIPEGNDPVGDTIYKNGKPEAAIVHRGYRPFIPNYIVIQSIATGESGDYHENH